MIGAMSTQQLHPVASPASPVPALADAIAVLGREASIELNVHDTADLQANHALLGQGRRVYVSFLPRQSWQQSIDTCRIVQELGLEPVPHLPVRLLADQATLDGTLKALVERARVQEVLLISGDYDAAVGPYSSVSEVLRTGALEAAGIRRVSIAGHPEGHPKVALEDVRRAEREKVRLLLQAGLEARFVTQFFFEPQPFLEWVGGLRQQGVTTPVAAGLAGPARLSTLFKFALRCGAGPSIRALGARPSSFVKLLGDHGPESVVRALTQTRMSGATDFSAIHLFCFGGFLRSCEWLNAVASGRIRLTEAGGFIAG
jgi:methylenetetrahydrofolate reductase (NADPH)